MKKKSPTIQKLSLAARQGAQFASTVAAHRGSQFLDQASSVVQNGAKFSTEVMKSPTTTSTTANSRRHGNRHHDMDDDRNDKEDMEYDRDDDAAAAADRSKKNATSSSTSASSSPPPFVSLKDRIHKFDTVASNRMESKKLFASPSISIRRKPRNRMVNNVLSSDRRDEKDGANARGPAIAIVVETAPSTEANEDIEEWKERESHDIRDRSISPPPFNPRFSTGGNVNVRKENKIHTTASTKEKENKVPNHHSRHKVQHSKTPPIIASPSSSASTSCSSSTSSSFSSSSSTIANTTTATRTPNNQHHGLASFTAAIRKTTPKKKRNPPSSAETTHSHSRFSDDQTKSKERVHRLEKQLKQLQKENQTLAKRNRALEMTCEDLWCDNRTLAAATASSSADGTYTLEDTHSEQSSTATVIKTKTHHPEDNLHPLISIPLQKHVKAVHEASESNSVVAIRKEPFRLMPPEESRVVALAIARRECGANKFNISENGTACNRYSEYCHLDTLGTLTGNHTRAMTGASSGNHNHDESKNDKTADGEDENDLNTKQVNDAIDLLNSAAFLFAGSSRRQIF